jgi:hypothetical protein
MILLKNAALALSNNHSLAHYIPLNTLLQWNDSKIQVHYEQFYQLYRGGQFNRWRNH